ncbi:MAG: carbon starvation protein A [Chloroflexi bacterium]|nr:carbon starvation protein A [Chloroflexota bacterium]
MNTLIAVIIGAITVYLGYNHYARRIDRDVIEADPKKVTPARMYMDGVDFVPTNRNVLYGYHFKSIAAAGPIVGAITAGLLWGWLPSILWLALGVVFLGWASDYSAIMVSVRNDGNSISAIAHNLIAPRTRTILLIFIFFYLLLVAGAFGNLIASVLNTTPGIPLVIIVMAVMGMLGGQMLYRWRMDVVTMTIITVGVTLIVTLLGPTAAAQWLGKAVNAATNAISGGQPALVVFDPTQMNPQTQTPGVNVPIMPSYIFWVLFMFAFCYLGAILPIWRYAQPINYIGFWLTALTIVLGGIGAALAIVLKPEVAMFKLEAFKGFMAPAGGGAIQPLWPMLFVTIACGAISGWHALIGSVGTARQIENETDVLPVGGRAMFSEFTLGLLSLLAVSVAAAGATAPAKFANGVGGFLSVFGLPQAYGTSLAFAAFVVIVITVVQLVFRLMRVTLAEGLGDRWPIMRNMHVATLIGMLLTLLLVLSGTWVYLWQLFGAANQLMAALSLLIVTVWLAATGRNVLYAGLPFLFMYVTTLAATLVTAYNLWATVFLPGLRNGWGIAIVGAGAMIIVALLLVVAALYIGYDGWVAYQRHRQRPMEARAAPAPSS